MKKLLYSTLVVVGAMAFAACENYLEPKSPSVVDAEFVFSNTTTARAALEGAYESWRATANSYVFGAGLFYAADVAGSDIERHPEAYTNQIARHVPESFYSNGAATSTYDIDSYSSNNNSGCYVQLFDVIGKANAVIQGFEQSAAGQEAIALGAPSGIGQMYGEAIALRATAYRELIKYYGDVPFATVFGEATGGLTPRDSIYDCILADLVRVEPLMYPVGSIPEVKSDAKNYFSKTYVDGLIGRIALEAGGYQTRRADITYINGKGEPVSFEQMGNPNANAANAFYARRSDYMNLYQMAKTYFKAAIDNAGTAKFYTTDPRAVGKAGQVYDNPHQYFFQQMMEDDAAYADESIYEYPMQWNVSSDERTYSSGRPSTGSSKGYPPKCYGQARINPAFYYGIFDPNDKRRDVAVTVTGTTSGTEIILPFTPGSQAKGGGLALNKWDDNRMKTPNTLAQRKAGVNGPYMRMAEIYLGYAEACAVTGDEANAKTYLKLIRERSFASAEQANTDGFIADCGGVFNAIIEERGFEFAGEGDRRFTLIRTGRLPWAIKRIKDMTKAMMDGLAANGSYTFANGNQMSLYVWIKDVNPADYGVNYRLTTTCVDRTNPVLWPAWRGQNDDWYSVGQKWGDPNFAALKFGLNETQAAATDKASDLRTNVAVKGMFEYIDPDGAEAKALEADGYVRTDWGKEIIDKQDNIDAYYTYIYNGYESKTPPIYMFPMHGDVIKQNPEVLIQGYGFQSK